MGILHRSGRPRTAIGIGILLLLAVLLHGCGGGGSNTTNSAPVSTTTVDGMVSKGPVADATITLFPLLPNGQRGTQVAPGAGQSAITTRGNGAWRATIPRTVTGPLLVVATGGSFMDEVTGTQMSVGNTTELLGLVPAGETAAAVTPVTHALTLATQTALQTAAAAGPTPDVNAMVATVITRATETFGFDPVRTLPPDPRALQGQSTAAVQYAAVLGGISQLLADARTREATGQEVPVPTGARLVALAQDLTDGVIDGQRAGQPISAPNGNVIPSLLPTSQTTTLADVANAFAMAPPTTTGLDRTTLQTTVANAPVIIVPPPGGNLATPNPHRSPVATVITVSVTPANSAPVPTAPALTTAQNTAGTRQVSPNDPDPGQSFTFSISTAPAHGSATVNASGLATYTPTTGFAGTDSFIVTVTDNGTPPLAGTVTIAVTVTASQNRPPTGASCGTARTIVEGNTTSLNVTAFDPDGDALSFAWQQNTPATPTGVFSAPTAASTTWTATGVAADTSFTLQVSVTDPQGAAATCQVSVTVKKTSAFVLDDINSTLDDDTRRLQ